MASFSLTLHSSAKCPGFFKLIVPMDCTKRLTLPPSHHWNKDDEDAEFPEEVVLMDQKENTWSVKLKKVNNQVCFVDGWLKFVRDNNVKVDNYIVFENVSGPNVYSFLIFDSNTKCETGGFIGFKSENQDEEQQQQQDAEEEDDFNWRGNTSTRIGPKDRMSNRTKSKGDSNRLRDIYAREIFESGVIPWPKNPYFVTRKRGYMGYRLYIPKNVVKDYNLYLQIKTIMRDNRGAEWATKLNECGDGRRWYGGGWGSFCRMNNVREGDYCVCEFIEEAGKGLILFVYKLEL